MTLSKLKPILSLLMRKPKRRIKPRQPTKAELQKQFRLVPKS